MRPDAPDYREYIEAIHDSGQHLLSVVDAVLDMAKMQSGAMELREETVDIARLFALIQRVMSGLARRRGVTLDVQCSERAPQVFADERVLRQILVNLVSNAVKYTYRDTSVVLHARRTPRGEVRIEVRDSGPGMTEAEVAHAMQPFKQLVDGRIGGLRSTGLGLPLVKALTELHDGQFLLLTQPGEGTRAIVRLPRTRVRGRACKSGQHQGQLVFQRAGSPAC